MRMKDIEEEPLKLCSMATSENLKDRYKHICKVTKHHCPFYEDEGMCVCKSKSKCISHFRKRLKRGKKIDFLLALKLLFNKV